MSKALGPEPLFDQHTNETSIPGSPPVETPSTVKFEPSDPPTGSEVSDDVLELLEGLPKRNQGVGTYNVLRVIASLHADVKLDRLNADAEHPIAELNTRFVQSITEKFSTKDLLEDVVANATSVGNNRE